MPTSGSLRPSASALADQIKTHQDDIKRLQDAIDKKVETAGKTEFKSSVVANVAAINAQLIKLIGGASAQEAVQIDEVAMNYANVASAGLWSLALLLLAPIACARLGGRRRIKIEDARLLPRRLLPLQRTDTAERSVRLP